MQKKIPVWVTVLVAVLLCVATFMTTYTLLTARFEREVKALLWYGGDALETEDTEDSSSSSSVSSISPFLAKAYKKLAEVDSLYRQAYIGELDDDELIDYIIHGYIAGTDDRFGAYYNAEEYQDFISDIEGETSGIGVNVIYNADYGVIEVLNVVKDSPAEQAGVLPGDLIVTAGEERESVAELGYYPAIDKLRGPVGTVAVFSVLRGDDYSESIDFEVVRAEVTSTTVMYHVYELDSSIGIIKISGFETPTPVQFAEAYAALVNAGCDKFVFDLRYNPGGELNSVVTTLDQILPDGPIVRITDASGNVVKQYDSEATEITAPMVLLVNGSTASAGELFTSAMRDYNKAKIVGTTTYGKGCMQTTVPLTDGSAVSVTFRLFNPPFSENFHGVGIEPDVVVELDEALKDKNIYKITDEEDNQLTEAVRVLCEGLN